jgi:serine protease Do
MAAKDTNTTPVPNDNMAASNASSTASETTEATAPVADKPTLTPDYAPRTPRLQLNHPAARPLAATLAAIVVLALGFGGGWLGAIAHQGDTPDITQQKTVLTSQAALVSSIAKTVGQSVVSVNVTAQAQASASPFDSFFGYGGGGSQTEQSAGTGMILTSSGLIMTNRHVVPAGTTDVSVTLSDGTVFNNVKVVGRTNDNSSLDVAFLQIQDTKGKKLTPVSLGDSSKVNVGDPVVAIGNALGQFQNTVTSGIISGHGRSVQASDSTGSSSENLSDLFQTDAAINEGNSGGPLVDLGGNVIGMNTAVASDSQNIGFAIPINDLTGLINSVEQSGKLQQPYLGVVYVPITNDVKETFNLTVDQGAYIPKEIQIGEQTIIPGGPADKAGVKPGDVITKIEGKAVNQTTSITSLIDKHKVGDKVTLTIVRGSKTLTLDVTLGSAPTS